MYQCILDIGSGRVSPSELDASQIELFRNSTYTNRTGN